jgi:hypothetical protein
VDTVQTTALLLSSVDESSNAITTRYQFLPGSSPGAELKRFASSELLKIKTAIGQRPNENPQCGFSFDG